MNCYPGLAEAKPVKLKQLTGGMVPIGFFLVLIATRHHTVPAQRDFKSSLYNAIGHVTRGFVHYIQSIL